MIAPPSALPEECTELLMNLESLTRPFTVPVSHLIAPPPLAVVPELAAASARLFKNIHPTTELSLLEPDQNMPPPLALA